MAQQQQQQQGDPLLPRKVARFYSRIFGETLVGKIPSTTTDAAAANGKKDGSSSAAASPASPGGKYVAREENASAEPVAADILKKVKTADVFGIVPDILRNNNNNSSSSSTAEQSSSSSSQPLQRGGGGNDYIMLYFSAAWCPPCRAFTPLLQTVYKTLNKAHLLSVTERADYFNNQQQQQQATIAATTASDGAGDAAAPSSPTATTTPPLHKPKVEVVFVSGDKTYEACEEYFATKHGDWLMVPYDEIKVRDKLLSRYGVTGFPTLVVLDARTGKVVTKAGVEHLRQDLSGELFPWRPDSVVEKLAKEAEITKRVITTLPCAGAGGGDGLIDAIAASNLSTMSSFVNVPFPSSAVSYTGNGGSSNTTTAAANNATNASTSSAAPKTKKVDITKLDHFALYFASHSSAPCRAFTPLLVGTYEDAIMKKYGEDRTEIIFVSLDENERHYEAFRSQMPWAAISHKHPIIPHLVKTLEVSSLPKLVTISVKDGGAILNSDCRAALGEEAEDFDPNATSEADYADSNAAANGSGASIKCGYPWARTKLPLVAPLVPSADVVHAIKDVPCVVLATNNASNASVLVTEFKTAAALMAEGGGLSSTAVGSPLLPLGSSGATASDGVHNSEQQQQQRILMEIEAYDPSRTSSSPSGGSGDDDNAAGGGESDKKRVQFFIADSAHVGSELLLSRLAMLLQENLPPSGVACVFSFDLRENISAGTLKSVHSKDIINYTSKFVKMCEDAAMASPAKNLSALQNGSGGPSSSSSSSRRPPQQPNNGGSGSDGGGGAPRPNPNPHGGGPSASSQQQQGPPPPAGNRSSHSSGSIN